MTKKTIDITHVIQLLNEEQQRRSRAHIEETQTAIADFFLADFGIPLSEGGITAHDIDTNAMCFDWCGLTIQVIRNHDDGYYFRTVLDDGTHTLCGPSGLVKALECVHSS